LEDVVCDERRGKAVLGVDIVVEELGGFVERRKGLLL